MTNEIQATAPTPQDWVELVRENERLAKHLELAESCLHDANYWKRKYESKAAECQEAYAEIGVLKGESE